MIFALKFFYTVTIRWLDPLALRVLILEGIKAFLDDNFGEAQEGLKHQ